MRPSGQRAVASPLNGTDGWERKPSTALGPSAASSSAGRPQVPHVGCCTATPDDGLTSHSPGCKAETSSSLGSELRHDQAAWDGIRHRGAGCSGQDNGTGFDGRLLPIYARQDPTVGEAPECYAKVASTPPDRSLPPPSAWLNG